MKQIRIPIPEKHDVIRWMKILRFKLTGGFSCTRCGSKSDFNHVLFDSTVNWKPLIFENNTRGICAECTRQELNDNADIVFTEDNCTCDWCGQTKTTMSFPRHKDLESHILFGSNYWNGHHICQHCINVGFDNRGSIHSSYLTCKNGKLYNKNELGLWIRV